MTPRRDDRGGTSVEVTIAVPVLLLLIMLVVQFGLWYHAGHVARAAADQGLRAARDPVLPPSSGQERAIDFLDAAGTRLIENRQVTATRSSNVARVMVTGRVTAVIPGLHLPVRATAAGSVERFRPDLP